MKHFIVSFWILVLLSEFAVGQTAIWQSVNGPVTSFSSKTNDVLLAGVWQGDIGILRSIDGGLTWSQSNSGLSNKKIRTLFVTDDGVFLTGTQQGIYRSTDDGNTWNLSSTGFSNVSYAMSFVQVSPNNLICVSYSNGAFKSTDNGLTWSSLNTGFGYYLRCIKKSPSGTLYIGTSDYGVIRSTNAGSNWTQVSTGLLHNDANSLAIDSIGQLYVGTWGKGIFKSTNNGDNWTLINGDIPDSLIQDVLVLQTGDIYLATSNKGIFKTTNQGTSWINISAGSSDQSGYKFHLTPTGHLLLGSLSGGIYRSVQQVTSVVETNVQVVNEFNLKQNYPNPFNPKTTIEFSLSKNSQVSLVIYNSLGQKVFTLLEGFCSSGEHEINFDAAKFASGTYYYELTVDNNKQVRKSLLLK